MRDGIVMGLMLGFMSKFATEETRNLMYWMFVGATLILLAMGLHSGRPMVFMVSVTAINCYVLLPLLFRRKNSP